MKYKCKNKQKTNKKQTKNKQKTNKKQTNQKNSFLFFIYFSFIFQLFFSFKILNFPIKPQI